MMLENHSSYYKSHRYLLATPVAKVVQYLRVFLSAEPELLNVINKHHLNHKPLLRTGMLMVCSP